MCDEGAMTMLKETKQNKQRGAVLVFVSIVMLVIISIVAMVVDLGRTYYEKRRIQYAADAAAIAGAHYVGGSSGSSVFSAATAAANANGVSGAELLSIECGRWIRGDDCSGQVCRTFLTCASGACTDCFDSQANAVRVRSKRAVGMSLAKLAGVRSMSPAVESIAMVRSDSDEHCIKPMGIEQAVIGNAVPGDIIIIGNNSPGNWGKLSLGGVNYSSGNNFSDALLSDVGACGDDVAVGEQIPSATGNGGSVRGVFSDAIRDGKNTNWKLAVITSQSNGQGSVTILEFVTVTLVSQSGNGNSWQARLRVVARNVEPSDPPNEGSGDRYLVK